MDKLKQFLSPMLPLELHEIIITSVIISIISISFVIIIGAIINKLEQLEMTILSHHFGIKFANICCNYFTFPGVIIHELAHALFASLSGAKIIEIKCFEFGKNGRLGHVAYRLRGNPIQHALQHSLCACAPVVTGLLIEGGIIYTLCSQKDMVWYLKTFLVYIFISVFNHMSMSKEDIKNYLRGMWCILPLIFIICALILLQANK